MILPTEISSQLLWVALRALLITLVLTPLCRDVFSSYAIVDVPDEGRKLHGRPIPRVGGIAICLGYFVSFFLFAPDLDQRLDRELSLVWRLLPAAILIFGVGLIDDFFGLKPWQKLIGQLGAALLAYWAGVRVLGVAGISMESAWWSLPVTVLWLLACTNAFNLVDGLDGLAAGVGFFATVTIFIAALLQNNEALAFATLPLAAAMLGFLCFNFNPATIFLGDGGSLFIGFLLGCFGAIWSQKSVTLIGMTAPLIAFAIPLLDVLLCVSRRFLRNKPIFGADRGHIHHRLLDRGLTPRRAVLAIYATSGIVAALSLLQTFVSNIYIATVVVVAFGAVIWGAVRFLGYAEFVLAGQILRSGGFQRLVTAQIEIDEFSKALAQIKNTDDFWNVLRAWHHRLGFDAVTLDTGANVYQTRQQISPTAWSVRIPLRPGMFVEFAQNQAESAPIVISSLIQALSSATQNLEQLQLRATSSASVAAPLQG
jgi:UDP-GlcNAc:undecaprenyl-phosphate GlcNAc-1-phosphate transferase